MKYYKLVLDDKIIGAVSSDNFIKFSPVTQSFLRSNESEGEFITWNGLIYRDTWMAPIRFRVDFIQVLALETSEEEYNIYVEALKINDAIEYEHQEEDPYPDIPYVDPLDQESVEFIRTSKINEMSYNCRKAIEQGFDLDIRGETYHFSLTTQDQLNLMSLGAMAQTSDLIPYHADGETCMFYTAEEINQIISAMNARKIYHTTYYNALKDYINSLETIEEIASITYGTPIPDEYKSEALKVIEQ